MSLARLACCGAVLLLHNNDVGRGVGGVEALPRNNNPKGRGDASPSAHQPRGGSGRGSVALHDAFPCEASSDSPPPASTADGDGGGASSAPANPSADYLSTNSFVAQNGMDTANPPASDASSSSNGASSSSLNTRGGASVEVGVDMDDEALDQIVDDLIAGLDDEGEGEEGIDEDEDVESAEDESEDEGEEESIEDEREEEEAESEDSVDDATTVTTEEPSHATIPEERPAPVRPNDPSPPISSQGRPTSQSSIATTPTNAYYRFLVRRGPKGHLLAAFTLIAVQWIYVYTPIIYQSVSSLLLKLRIYDPQLLHEKDRERRMRAKYGPPKKRGLTSKLFGSSKKDAAQREKARVKQEDAEAASKLKQLYRTMKVGGGMGMLSEVKYRYLSPAFRRRHGLGNEYRVEKPRTFLGEVVEGNAGRVEDGVDGAVSAEDIVFSDGELEGDTEGLERDEEETIGKDARKGSKGSQKRHGKRKKINDWVVGAFVSHRRPSRAKASTTATSSTSDSESNRPPSALWKTVERGAILEAAWASRAAEQSAIAKKFGRRTTGKSGPGEDAKTNAEMSDEEPTFDAATPAAGSTGSGYGASKMFQSVMSRVGTNGRIFGAYPNDAPPIEECAHERGVLGLARRYGYGEWRAEGSHRVGADAGLSDDEEEGLSGWGGAFDEVREDAPLHSTPARKRRRKKKAQPSPSSGRRKKRRSKGGRTSLVGSLLVEE